MGTIGSYTVYHLSCILGKTTLARASGLVIKVLKIRIIKKVSVPHFNKTTRIKV